MNPRLLPVIISAALITLASCQSKKDILSRVWFYTHAERTGGGGHEKNGDPELTPVNFLNLQPDGHYTAYFASIEYGTWKVENEYIILRNQLHLQRQLRIRGAVGNELNLDIQPNNKDEAAYYFEGSPQIFKDKTEDPFSIENNRWRIKAEKKETDAQILQRLKDHFRYWEKYFNWGLKTDKSTLDVRSLKGPLKIYGNGFALVRYEEWSDEWRSCFFDEEDRRIAYNRLNNFFNQDNAIAWPKSDNKFKQFMSAFQQLQQKLE